MWAIKHRNITKLLDGWREDSWMDRWEEGSMGTQAKRGKELLTGTQVTQGPFLHPGSNGSFLEGSQQGEPCYL